MLRFRADLQKLEKIAGEPASLEIWRAEAEGTYGKQAMV
jgi:hypothetical protein